MPERAKWKLRILAAARAGESPHSISKWAGISMPAVKRVIHELDPNFRYPGFYVPPPRPQAAPGTICAMCPNEVPPDRLTLCSEECYEVQEIWWELTEYRSSRQEMIARSILKNPSSKPYNRRWAEQVLAGNTPGRRGIVKDSRRWRLLEERGLIEKLPEDVEIIVKRPKKGVRALRQQLRDAGLTPEV